MAPHPVEWLVIEWPEGEAEPTKYWLSTLPEDMPLVVLVGQKKAIAIAVRDVSGRRRWSKLDEWLRHGAPSRSSNSPAAG